MAQKKRSVEYVSIEKIKFDPENPRLPSTIDGNDESAVLDWMLDDASLIELMASIGEHDYFPGEPLLVVPPPKRSAYATAVEGNRRLAAVKLLSKPELASVRKNAVKETSDSAKYKPHELPVLGFDHRDEILDYLGYRHITGIKEWGPLAKAKYLKQLFIAKPKEQDTQAKFQELAKSIGSRANYVARLLAGIAIYDKIADKEFFGIKGLKEDSIDFSLLTTALSYNSIANFLGLQSAQDHSLKGLKEAKLKELTSWLFEKVNEGRTRVGESRNLKLLSAIVENAHALEAFRNGFTLADAILLTKMPTEAFRTATLDARSRLEVARDYIHLVDSPTQSDADVLSDIRKMAQDLRTLVLDRLANAGEK